MENILEVRGLCKDYKTFSLSDVTFTVPEGCIAGFIGINGAGKTTTIKSMLNLVWMKAGEIRILGMDLSKDEKEIKDRVGVVLDGGCFYDDLTLNEMKSVIAPAYSQWSDQDYERYLDLFSLQPRHKISTLSKGMRMKFALTLALSHHADLLIMDEPTSGLDPLIRSQLLEILVDYMKQGGRGVFFSTHITSDLDKVADMLILIHDGKILFQEEKDMLLETHRVVKGDAKALNSAVKNLLLNYEITDFGFAAITNRLGEVKRLLPDVLVERPTIEDIMLAHIKGGDAR